MWQEPKNKTGLPVVMDLKEGLESSLILSSSLLSTILLFTHLTGLIEEAFNIPWPGENFLIVITLNHID